MASLSPCCSQQQRPAGCQFTTTSTRLGTQVLRPCRASRDPTTRRQRHSASTSSVQAISQPGRSTVVAAAAAKEQVQQQDQQAQQQQHDQQPQQHEQPQHAPRPVQLLTCRRCFQRFSSAENSAHACSFHPAMYTGGEVAKAIGFVRESSAPEHQLGAVVGRTGLMRFWDCCGAADEAALGCVRGYHLSFDQELNDSSGWRE